jgi:DNA-binding transcriptional MerR regulator
MGADLSSGDLARATGSTVRTIRFYEEEGLLKPVVLRGGGHRRYTEEDLDRLRLISDLRELGMSICEIRAMLDLRTGCRTAAEFAVKFRQVVEEHLQETQRRLERLRRVRKEMLDGLAIIEERLKLAGHDECVCAVAGAERVPRMVKVLARQAGCCEGGEHVSPQPGQARSDAPGAPTAQPGSLVDPSR